MRLRSRVSVPRVSNGVGRRSTPSAEAVSAALRGSGDPHVLRRRRAAGLLLGAVGSLTVVALYQFGVVRHLPDPPLPGFDSDRVDASGEAYRPGDLPDSVLAIANYGTTLALLGMGAGDRWRTRPWIPLLAAVKAGSDAAGGLVLTAEQITRHRAVCGWCLLASAASVAAVPLTVPEARAALAHRRG